MEYRDPRDREAAGLICASLALGRVDCIVKACRRLLQALPVNPSGLQTAARGELERCLEGFVYRFFDAHVLAKFLTGIGKILKNYDTLENLFLEGYLPNRSVSDGTEYFVNQIRIAAGGLPGILLSAPSAGSACKRINLFLRWMVRSDAVDPGCWSSVDRSGLLVPLDTHMLKVARSFGATARKNADRKTVFEITKWFSRLNPADPVKYDFCILRPYLNFSIH